MRYLTLVLCLLSVATATSSKAQIISPSRIAISPTPPDTMIASLTRRIEALESLVAQLQQKTAFIKSTNPLVLDTGSDLSIRANAISLDAATAISVRAFTNTSIRSNSTLLIEAAGVLDLKGSTVRHNGGSMPVACGISGSAAPCSNTVGVPPPGQ